MKSPSNNYAPPRRQKYGDDPALWWINGAFWCVGAWVGLVVILPLFIIYVLVTKKYTADKTTP